VATCTIGVLITGLMVQAGRLGGEAGEGCFEYSESTGKHLSQLANRKGCESWSRSALRGLRSAFREKRRFRGLVALGREAKKLTS
jgi:hypothetical protein